ncbi:hypothetical protein HUG10_00395 [Halorarum halophilum]|uniref:Uncharacterized protein n=1 Tax=Halorarum halophilum TaxID=2743090 RepID=A0A7D5GDE5_9EURY|nr:hypothetical protein [Halobaculum halophilum]QLG26090.1 hypothetical protein HUG10_00395 [Halobaculum halophilum]
MARRPPQGGSGDREAVEFGIAVLDARLDDAGVTFPATAEEVLSELDDTKVAYDASGHTLDLRDAFAEVDAERFESETELLNAVYPAFEARRKRAADSLIARLRALLPM